MRLFNENALKSNKVRRFALVVALLFAVTVLLSFDFTAKNIHHDCSGTDCVVCSVLQIADELIGGAKKVAAISAFFAFAVFSAFALKTASDKAKIAVTPISLKDILTI